MKKEIFALSLLALLFAASLFNIRYFDRLCLDIAAEVRASTADAFYELGQELGSTDGESCRAAFDKLLYHLESIRTMEHLRFGSIM